ncbi:MAG: hypothetical protein PHV68_02885 [Candidatus Gastranaerophilales bacterium]|nr:hypothetical protein [Candidatus Gastranaerophilales bacterium]
MADIYLTLDARRAAKFIGRFFLFSAGISLICWAVSGILLYFLPVSGAVKESHSLAVFDSRSVEAQERQIKTVRLTSDSRQNGLRIAFSFKVYQFRQFDNLFQTDPVNSGIRMEMSAPAALALIIAGPDGPKGIYITRMLRLNKVYQLEMRIDRFDNLQVFLNKRLVVNECVPGARYKLSDVVIGSGFSRTRGFDGRISDFIVETEVSPAAEFTGKLKDYSFKIAILLLIAAAVSYFLYKGADLRGLIFRPAAAFIKASLEALRNNMLLLHFFIFSLGMLPLIHFITDMLSLFTAKNSIIFNEWVVSLVVPGKNRDLITYAAAAGLLFVYYALCLWCQYGNNGKIGKKFSLFFSSFRGKPVLYLAGIMVMNLFVLQRNKGALCPYFNVIQPVLWLIFFLAPFFIVLRGHPAKKRGNNDGSR